MLIPTIYFLQYIPCFATTPLIHKFSIYLNEDSTKVTVQTNHGYKFKVRLNIDVEGRCYFQKGLWRKFATRYVLKADPKVLVDIRQPGAIIHVKLPNQIRRWTNNQS